MNNWLNQTNPAAKYIIAIVMLVIAAVLYGVSHNLSTSFSSFQAAHEETQADSNVVTIEGNEILSTDKLNPLSGRILNNIYAQHYQKTGLLERKATYNTDLSKKGGDGRGYSFGIIFLPSKTKYDVSLTIDNINDKDFTIEVK